MSAVNCCYVWVLAHVKDVFVIVHCIMIGFALQKQCTKNGVPVFPWATTANESAEACLKRIKHEVERCVICGLIRNIHFVFYFIPVMIDQEVSELSLPVFGLLGPIIISTWAQLFAPALWAVMVGTKIFGPGECS